MDVPEDTSWEELQEQVNDRDVWREEVERLKTSAKSAAWAESKQRIKRT